MDFKIVTDKILSAFARDNVRYALMGGYALGLWGVGRTTVDLDFLVDKEDMGKVDQIMKTLGYERKFASDNVSQYVSPFIVFGEIDFLHAFRDASLSMLQRAVDKEIFGGAGRMRVLRPEDIIGLKLQAMNNDRTREGLDKADIDSLLVETGADLDWSLLGEYFRIFNKMADYEELKRKYAR